MKIPNTSRNLSSIVIVFSFAAFNKDSSVTDFKTCLWKKKSFSPLPTSKN